MCRFCCKSPFALVIKIYFGCTGDFRVKMWGTSSPDDKLTDDLGNAIEGTRISGRRWIFLTAEKLAPSDSGLLQQYRQQADLDPGSDGPLVRHRRPVRRTSAPICRPSGRTASVPALRPAADRRSSLRWQRPE